MCGLAGVVCFSAEQKPDSLAGRVGRSVSKLRHRGPDGNCTASFSARSGGQWEAALGHSRLAILDLDARSSQPFTDEDGAQVLVFNGEIYNFKELRAELQDLGLTFKTEGDTEVLYKALRAWGTAALERLEGMFAFAFLDLSNNKILLARDPFGIKPLYFTQSSEELAFSSDIPSLMHLLPGRPALNRELAAQYISSGWHDYSNETFVQGVTSLDPGSLIEIDLKTKRQSSQIWWKPSAFQTFTGSFREASEVLRDILLESVSLHLRSDVPVGATLSGGLDSSTIVSLVRHLEPDAELHTFSYIDPNPSASEEIWVDKVSKQVRSKSHKVSLGAKDLRSDEFIDLIRTQGEPFGSASIYAQYKVFQSANQQGIKVTLDGQGADEMFGGYAGFPEARIASLFDNTNFVGAARFAWAWSKWPDRNLLGLASGVATNYFPWLRSKRAAIVIAQSFGIAPEQGFDLLSAEAIQGAIPQFEKVPSLRGRRLAEELSLALGYKRLVQLMRVADRNSMRWSVEGRVPFLTRKIADFALSLPEEFLVSDAGETKSILRHSMRGIVLDEVLDRRDKIGFKADHSGWLAAHPEPESLFSGLEHLGLFERKKLQAKVDQYAKGYTAFDELGWRLMNLATWARIYGVEQ